MGYAKFPSKLTSRTFGRFSTKGTAMSFGITSPAASTLAS
jgi:hypothetical protein